jgi:hypothetical protein
VAPDAPPDTGTGTTSAAGSFSDPNPGDDNSGTAVDPTTLAYGQFTRRLYLDTLQRAPSTDDVQYWVGQLQNGMSRTAVASAVVSSPEFLTDEVQRDYRAILGRPADPRAIQFWVGQMAGGLTEEQLRIQLLASNEFFKDQRGVERSLVLPAPDGTKQPAHAIRVDDATSWISALYGLETGRQPDAAGLAYWKTQYRNGASRLSIVQAFVDTNEAHASTIRDIYTTLLRRPADDTGLYYWVHAAGTTFDAGQLVGLLAGSDEYFTSKGVESAPDHLPPPSISQEGPAPGVTSLGDQSSAGSTEIDGTGSPGAPFVITLDQTPVYTGTVGDDGSWQVVLPVTVPGGYPVVNVYPAGGAVSPFSAPPTNGGSGTGGSLGAGGGSSGSGSSPGSGSGASGSGGHSGRTAVLGVVNATTVSGGDTFEVEIGIDPTNPQDLFLASNQFINNGGGGLYAAYSTDAGQSWTGRIIADGSDGLPTACCDPDVVWDTFGNMFLSYLNAATDHAVITMSTDGGKTLTSLATFPAADYPRDAVGAGTVWIVFNNSDIEAAGAKVTGLGNVGAFGSVVSVPNSSGENFGDIAIGAKGQVVVTFQNAGSGVGPDNIMFSIDATGIGGSFVNPIVASPTNVGAFDPIPAQPARTIDSINHLAYDTSSGPHAGRLYLLYTDADAVGSGNTDNFVRFSDDDGATWSAPVRVNDDTGTNSQFLPDFAVDPTNGDIAVSWYDCRFDNGSGPFDTDGKPNTDTVFFASVSQDGGQTFQPNVQVSTNPSNAIANEATNPNDYGDFTGVAFFGGMFYPAWADNSTSIPNSIRPGMNIAVGIVSVTQSGSSSGIGSLGPVEDQFEPNDTSDKATNLGVLPTTMALTGLTITKHANGLPDYDWFRFTMPTAGTLSVAIQCSNPNLELEIFTLSGPNTLFQLADVTAPTQTTKSTAVQVQAGQTILVEIKGLELTPGVFGQGTYELDTNLA